MTFDIVKWSKQDNKQIGRKAARLVQLNSRFCILLFLLLITILLVVHLNQTLHRQPKHLSLHQYVRNFFDDHYRLPLKSASNNSNDEENFSLEEFDLIWSEESIELFRDQLGILNDGDGDDAKSLQCHTGEEFIVSALPGPNDENLSDVLWQYVSITALQSQIVQTVGNKKLSLRAFVTEQMRVVLDQLFEG